MIRPAALTPAALAMVELGAREVEEPGSPVRCVECGGKRLKLWAPGLFHCDKCHAQHVFLGATQDEPRRVRCARRCRRAVFYLERGAATCVECGRCVPMTFETGAACLIVGRRVLWRSEWQNPIRYRTVEPISYLPI